MRNARVFVDISHPTRLGTFEGLAAYAAVFYGRPIKFYTIWRGREVDARATAQDIENAYREALAVEGTTPERDEAVEPVFA